MTENEVLSGLEQIPIDPQSELFLQCVAMWLLAENNIEDLTAHPFYAQLQPILEEIKIYEAIRTQP